MQPPRIVFGPIIVLALVVSAYAPALGMSYEGVGHKDVAGFLTLVRPAISASIVLHPGWNLVASPLIPVDSSPPAAFSTIAGQYDLVYAYDACDSADPWKKFDPQAPPMANDLPAVTVERGLWIRATAATTWVVTGTQPAQFTVPLCAGQNLIAYPSPAAAALPAALASISGSYTQIYAYDAADTANPWRSFDPEAPAFVNDLTALGPTQGYWINMTAAAILTVGTQPGATRQVNAPYFDGALNYAELAVFWFGRITPTENYADVRVGYNHDQLVVNVAAFDRRLWYDVSPSPGDLSAWDAVTMYLSLDGGTGDALGPNAYRLIGQLTWWEDPRTQWQAAYRHDGAAWAASALSFSTSSGWRGDVPNNSGDDRGWNLSFGVPFASLGLASQPPEGTTWRMAIVLHDRDDAAGTPISDKLWPDAMSTEQPATWGLLRFGVPTYTPPAATNVNTTTIRHGLNGAVVQDAAVGGSFICGAGTDYWTQWGETTEAFYGPDLDRFNVQNQSDISDWPCFSKVYVTFPLSSVPAGKAIISATLTLHQIGNAGEGWTPGPQPSFIQVLAIDEPWEVATLTWNGAPLAGENITGAWVDPLAAFPGWPGVARQWDLSRAVARARERGQSDLRLVLYSADEAYHSGRYFSSSEAGDWDLVGRPTLDVAWAD